MEPNPYEAPRNNGKRCATPWSHIAGYGLIASVAGVFAILVTATFSYMPDKHPVLFTVHLAIVVASLVGIIGGLAAAVVGGIGHALSK